MRSEEGVSARSEDEGLALSCAAWGTLLFVARDIFKRIFIGVLLPLVALWTWLEELLRGSLNTPFFERLGDSAPTLPSTDEERDDSRLRSTFFFVLF